MPDESTDESDVSALAQEVVAELDPGTVIDDKLILSRRQAIGLATGSIGVGVLATLGVGEASAQAAGNIGTASDPIDIEAYDLNAQNSLTDAGDAVLSSPDADYEVQKDGTDGTGVINFKTQ